MSAAIPSRIWLCEKPSQAKDIAGVLASGGTPARREGYFETPCGVVTWAIGHLLEQASPEHYDEALERWQIGSLPIIPDAWQMRPVAKTRSQLMVVRACLRGATEVVIATDADREGESIARELLDAAGYRGKLQRLWLSALDEKSIRAALARLRADEETRPLYWAAQARSRADWLVGMNITRAQTLLTQAHGGRGVRSVGRVQTPTLALVVRRDRAIENHIARDFFELSASVVVEGTEVRLKLRHAPAAQPEDRRIYDRERAEALATQAQHARGPLRVSTERKRAGPPKLFSLSALQKACSAKYGWSADHTLRVAQSLYETHKLTSYPRSDCSYLPSEQASEVPEILRHLSKQSALASGIQAVGVQPLIRQDVFDSSKITAHHAIIPTTVSASLGALSEDERRAYLLIAKHYLAALAPDHVFDETRIFLDANSVPFSARGMVTREQGWRAVFEDGEEEPEEEEGQRPLPAVADGAPGRVERVLIEGRTTKPPPRYTEGTLIEDMRSVAKFADDPAIKARLKETSGIGTEATRASIIKTLRDRGFVVAQGKQIRSTDIGRELVDSLPRDLTDPALTAAWEDALEAIATGRLPESARDQFVGHVARQVAALVAQIAERLREAATSPQSQSARDGAPSAKMLGLAQAIGEQMGLARLPTEVATSFAACRSFIDANKPNVDAQRATGRPSEKQVAWAQQIAAHHGIALPVEVLNDRAACSEFIESHRRDAGASPKRASRSRKSA